MTEAERKQLEHDVIQMGKTGVCLRKAMEAARIRIMQAADPVAADRAKRYIWSRIERNQASTGRAE